MLELVLECFVGLCLERLVRVWKGWAWFGIVGLDLMYISELFYVFGSVWFG